jgi:anthranilate phosphoribosyltransferase
MTATPFTHVLARLAEGARLTRAETRGAMDAIMQGDATPAQIGAFLMALRLRGETPEEIAGAAESMRAHARRIRSDRRPLLDTCGTGGDRSGTFNISTAAAFVVAGAGLAVAKHGNRSVSSRCGSADVLEALGARIDLPPEGVEACLAATGMGFLFAPLHHGAMKYAAAPRKELALRTLFNVLGPLSNPAGATHQVLGVYAAPLTETLATVLSILGSEGAMVVHGEGGLDEIALSGPTRVTEWRNGTLRTYTVTPAGLGATEAPPDTLRGGDAAQNAGMIRALLTDREGPPREVVCLNAGAALYVAGRAATLREGVEAAREVVASGRAAAALQAFVDFTRNWSA